MASFPINQCRVVMVETTHAGNIGAAARAMKTMGLEQLHLVRPLAFPSVEATARASGAGDILQRAVVHDSLEEALADTTWVFGASARRRTLPWPCVTPRQMGQMVSQHPVSGQVAIVFGREARGLTNEELEQCHYHVTIPTNEAYGVLNISAAIQVLCYELRMALVGEELPPLPGPQMHLPPVAWDEPPVDQASMELFIAHFERVLEQAGFLDPRYPAKVMPRLRRMFLRLHMDKTEMGIMRGALKAIERKLSQ